MKRGLVLLDSKEVPPHELLHRVDVLQTVLRDRGLLAALVYGDVYHSGDITYLSNICIYWNEGLLLVPSTGAPSFLTKLSARVQPWMRSISNLDDLRSGPNFAALVGKYFEDVPSGSVGLAEMDWWPSDLLPKLQGALVGREFHDLGAVIRRARQSPSPAELALLRDSARLTARSVNSGLPAGLTNKERAGFTELTARRGGAEDVVVRCVASADFVDTIEVVCEYRGYWTLAARVVAESRPNWLTAIERAFSTGEKELRAGSSAALVSLVVAGCLEELSMPWRVDLIHHTDLETGGGFRTQGEIEDVIQSGSVVAFRLEVDFDGGSQVVLADTYEIANGGSVRLTEGLLESVGQSIAV